MSLEQHGNAILEGYRGPFFPDKISRLQEVIIATRMVTGDLLGSAADRVYGYYYISRPRTSDGYGWFWALHFEVLNGKELAILFPWKDPDQDHGTYQRSIAVHTKGNISQMYIARVIDELIRAMYEFRQELDNQKVSYNMFLIDD